MSPGRARRVLEERRDWLRQLPPERLKWHATGELQALEWLLDGAHRGPVDHLAVLADRAAWLDTTAERYESNASSRHRAVSAAIKVALERFAV